jgi:hypothetical protein
MRKARKTVFLYQVYILVVQEDSEICLNGLFYCNEVIVELQTIFSLLPDTG